MPAADGTTQSALALERMELQNTYLGTLHSIISHGCHTAMVSKRNQASFPTVLMTLLQSADTAAISVIKSAFVVLRDIVKQFVPASGQTLGAVEAAASPVFLRFVWDQAAAACFTICASPKFDFDDAAANLACTEVRRTHRYALPAPSRALSMLVQATQWRCHVCVPVR